MAKIRKSVKKKTVAKTVAKGVAVVAAGVAAVPVVAKAAKAVEKRARRPRTRVTSSGPAVANWFSQEKARPSSFIPAPPRAEAPSLVAAPPASSDRLIRPEELHIRDDLAIAAFRILEEALTNVARHSGATRAEVRVREKRSELLLEIRDNGSGIAEADRLAPDAYGLIGMKERAAIFGGTLEITGVKGRGTIVTVRIPLRP